MLPEGLTELPGGIFQNCPALTALELPNGLKYIGGSAFCGCHGLRSLTIPASVIEIGESAFDKTLVLRGASNSIAFRYAVANGNPFALTA